MIANKNEYDECIKLANKAADAYYNSGTPIMSDENYDLLIESIQEFEEKSGIVFASSPTQKVGAPVLSALKKVSITPKPMLSLAKCHSDEEVAEFAKNQKMVAMVKLDGLSVRIKYNNGKMISANTRGNGVEGTDITEHVKQFQNVPLNIPFNGELVIDGEAIIKMSDFEIINKYNEFKNPRNAAAGALNVLDTKLVKDRKLSFLAWDIIEQKDTEFGDTYAGLVYLMDKLKFANKLGFEVVPALYWENDSHSKPVEEMNRTIMAFKEFYPCDGVVWKFNDTVYGNSLGQTSHHFKNGIAWKPEVEIAESKLQNIVWQPGRTGVLTPVAIFDEVELDGSVISRASLHNYSIMEKVLGACPYVGENLKIIKANMIIPQIIEAGPQYGYWPATAQELELIPVKNIKCPVCGHQASLEVSDNGIYNLICENPNCSGKLINCLDHFCGKKGLDIKGLSKATLEKLIAWEWVSNFSDIYELFTHKIDWVNTPGFGEKSVQAILTAIENSKTQTLEAFISAIGIPLIGKSVAKEICKHVSTYEEFRELVNTGYDFSKWNTFGSEKCYSLKKYDFTEADKVAKYINFIQPEVEETTNSLDGITVVITGKLYNYKNRTALQKEIEKHGGKVSSSVSGNTSYLINNDIESASAKNVAAKTAGIPIISEKEFIEKFLR